MQPNPIRTEAQDLGLLQRQLRKRLSKFITVFQSFPSWKFKESGRSIRPHLRASRRTAVWHGRRWQDPLPARTEFANGQGKPPYLPASRSTTAWRRRHAVSFEHGRKVIGTLRCERTWHITSTVYTQLQYLDLLLPGLRGELSPPGARARRF